jgi:hypothetical protein
LGGASPLAGRAGFFKLQKICTEEKFMFLNSDLITKLFLGITFYKAIYLAKLRQRTARRVRLRKAF